MQRKEKFKMLTFSVGTKRIDTNAINLLPNQLYTGVRARAYLAAATAVTNTTTFTAMSWTPALISHRFGEDDVDDEFCCIFLHFMPHALCAFYAKHFAYAACTLLLFYYACDSGDLHQQLNNNNKFVIMFTSNCSNKITRITGSWMM